MGQVAGVTAEGRAHGFPVALTSFVGRADEVAEAAALLGEFRLVTVTGPGGMGKTRLAGEVAARVAGRFADGVWLVDLASVADPALWARRSVWRWGPARRRVCRCWSRWRRRWAGQQVLLVLDNCEHVLGTVAELCAGLLPVADDIRVLATSREPVGVAGEARFRLGPLGLPGEGNGAGTRLRGCSQGASRDRWRHGCEARGRGSQWRLGLRPVGLAYRSLGVRLELTGSFRPSNGGDCPLALVQIDRLSKSQLGRTAAAEQA
jgi:hypothetical protein